MPTKPEEDDPEGTLKRLTKGMEEEGVGEETPKTAFVKPFLSKAIEIPEVAH